MSGPPQDRPIVDPLSPPMRVLLEQIKNAFNNFLMLTLEYFSHYHTNPVLRVNEVTACLDSVSTSLKRQMAPNHECPICLERIGARRYGLLENCGHGFCEPCLFTLVNNRNTGRTLECPYCRTTSNRVAFTDTFFADEDCKKVIFNTKVLNLGQQ